MAKLFVIYHYLFYSYYCKYDLKRKNQRIETKKLSNIKEYDTFRTQNVKIMTHCIVIVYKIICLL